MALSDSQKAIGATTKLLRDHLTRHGFLVDVGKPEDASNNNTSKKLNLFLYQVEFDPNLRNVSLDDTRPPPLWLRLKYLLTAFDDSEASDSADAHELLGEGVTRLHQLNFLRLDASADPDVRLALESNPEPLKITFDQASVDLVSGVTQGTDERYRLSMAFEVRPVMLVPDEPPPFSLLVGVDHSQVPPAVIGDEGVEVQVLPSLGARLASVAPETFDPGQTIRITGTDLHLGGLTCSLGDVPLRVVAQRPDRLDVLVESTPLSPSTDEPIRSGTVISAGEHLLVVREQVTATRQRASNVLVGRLRPVATDAVVNAGPELVVSGLLLGTADDDVLVALYRDGAVVRLFDTPTVVADQTSLTISMAEDSPDAGTYQVIVRVNGVQARLSPVVVVSP